MGTYKNKTYPLRIDNVLQAKVKQIADKEDRPLSKQYERIIRQYVEEYESKNGNIIIQNNGIIQNNINHNGDGDININK